jgi:hypothetical protein
MAIRLGRLVIHSFIHPILPYSIGSDYGCVVGRASKFVRSLVIVSYSTMDM